MKPTVAVKAFAQINEYLAIVPGDMLGLTAALELRQEFNKLVANLGLGTTRIGGPFETRRVHRFRLEAAERPRLAHVVYRVTSDGTVDILRFSAVPI